MNSVEEKIERREFMKNGDDEGYELCLEKQTHDQ